MFKHSQNEFLHISPGIVQNKIVAEVKEDSFFFTLIVDETIDISTKEPDVETKQKC